MITMYYFNDFRDWCSPSPLPSAIQVHSFLDHLQASSRISPLERTVLTSALDSVADLINNANAAASGKSGSISTGSSSVDLLNFFGSPSKTTSDAANGTSSGDPVDDLLDSIAAPVMSVTTPKNRSSSSSNDPFGDDTLLAAVSDLYSSPAQPAQPVQLADLVGGPLTMPVFAAIVEWHFSL